ncbi:hypothetical protein [Tsukamurella sp. USMM236]|uniref:hypothetical protein n=1 Tax=Tsukamurella sp. USMM236 TaxID=3081301 RepID=UPI003019FD43
MVVATVDDDGATSFGDALGGVEDVVDVAGALAVSVDPQLATSETAVIPAAMSSVFFTGRDRSSVR